YQRCSKWLSPPSRGPRFLRETCHESERALLPELCLSDCKCVSEPLALEKDIPQPREWNTKSPVRRRCPCESQEPVRADCSLLSLRHMRIERIAQAIAHQIATEYRQKDQDARNKDQSGILIKES